MPDTRGDVLCPTCGLWTPPAPFCTECGAALQLGVQESASGGGSDVFRRGHEVEEPGSPWGQSERFEPEPEDEAARGAAAAAAAAGAAGAPRVDHFAEIEPATPEPPPWPSEPGLDADAPPAADETHPGVAMGAAAVTAAAMAGADDDLSTEEPAPPPKRRTRAKAAGAAAAAGAVAGAAAIDPAAGAPPPPEPTPSIIEPPPPASPPVTYAGPPQDGGDDGNSGVSGLVFVLFLGLGILALLGGAILGGVFDGGVADASPTPTASVSTPTPEPSLAPSASASSAPSISAPSVAPTPTPVPAPDGFIARAEACDEQPTDSTCDSSGATNDGHVWILVSFRHGQATDVIGVSIRDESGSVVDQGSFPLNFCGASTDCAGYTYFEFSNLADGDYDVVATRNGDEVATTTFTVE
jgi:hypothetical protein